MRFGVGWVLPGLALMAIAGAACASSKISAPISPSPSPSSSAVHPVAPATARMEPPSPSSAPVVVARVQGQAISGRELEAHRAATGLPRFEALEDLIDLALLRQAAGSFGIALPAEGLPPNEVREAAAYQVACKLSLDVPPAVTVLVVNHAWVKDAPQAAKRAQGRAAMERLRGLVAGGATIPAAYSELGTDGAGWHLGDHEEYPYDVVPPPARDLPAGRVSPLIEGNGGLHLFTIIERKQTRPAAELVRAALHDKLRAGKAIEVVQGPAAP